MEQPTPTADLARRFPGNPLLIPTDILASESGLRVECLLNPGAFRFAGKIWLLLRVAERPEQKEGYTSFPILGANGTAVILEFSNDDSSLNLSDPRVMEHNNVAYLTTLSHLRLVSSADGIHFEEESYPPISGQGELEAYGIEDCRVTQIGECYYLTYTAVSPCGVGVGMRSTEDWRSFKDHGMIIPPHNKDCALFEAKIGESYYAFHRPSGVSLGGNFIWLAQSPDLRHWGGNRCVAKTRPGMWDCARIGAGASPIRTPEGWLAIYHGADENHRYCLGALLLDLDEPWRVLARSQAPIMEPLTAYEQTGFFGNVVFTNGHIVDGDRVTIYYGASDSVICGAHFSIREILATLTE